MRGLDTLFLHTEPYNISTAFRKSPVHSTYPARAGIARTCLTIIEVK